jgi:hypothetical protein
MKNPIPGLDIGIYSTIGNIPVDLKHLKAVFDLRPIDTPAL